MRWIQPQLFPGALRARLVRAKQVPWEAWLKDVEQPCLRCKSLDVAERGVRRALRQAGFIMRSGKVPIGSPE